MTRSGPTGYTAAAYAHREGLPATVSLRDGGWATGPVLSLDAQGLSIGAADAGARFPWDSVVGVVCVDQPSGSEAGR
jgi:hypothetical protein